MVQVERNRARRGRGGEKSGRCRAVRGRIDSTPDLVRNTVGVKRERGTEEEKNRVNEPEEVRE